MTPRYKYQLDGTYYDDPLGWSGWRTDLRRDDGLRGIIEQQQGAVTFSGDAYSYIHTKREEGYCASIAVTIWEDCGHTGNYTREFDGNIFLSDVVFNITHCRCECTLVDDSYFARIANNRQVECSIGAGKSKNGEGIDVPILYNVVMFNPCDGVTSGLPSARAYRAHDVCRYLIQFMTDGVVEFQSTVLDFGGEFEGVMLTKGLLLSDPTNPDKGVIFTWDNYLRNICNLCNLAWRVAKIAGTWTFILEKKDDTFTGGLSATFPTVHTITRRIDTEKNYAAVELGSDATIPSLGCSVLGGAEPAFPDQINLLGCKREQFAVTGTCNIDSVLSLTTDWIISSNVIESIYFNGDTGYDDQIILIHCDNFTTLGPHYLCDAIQGDVFGVAPPTFYNTAFYNEPVAKRHFRYIPASLVKYLNAPETAFKATHTSAETVTYPLVQTSVNAWEWPILAFGDDYTPDNNDLNNDYGNSTLQGNPISQWNSAFISPFGNVYRFKNTFHVHASAPFIANPFGAYLKFTYKLYDAADNPLGDFVSEIYTTIGVFGYHEVLSPLIYIEAGYKIRVKLEWTLGHSYFNPALMIAPLTFELAATGLQGGTFEIFNPEDYIADLYEFKTPMSMAEFRAIREAVTDKIQVDDGKNSIRGWIDTISFDRHKNMADITLVTDGR